MRNAQPPPQDPLIESCQQAQIIAFFSLTCHCECVSPIASRGVMQRPRIEIVYCTQCRWLMRAAWMAQELLTTFESELNGVTLAPGTGGVFEISIDGKRLWSRKDQGRFPDIKELKQLVRDSVAPERDLGHSDRPAGDKPTG